MRYTLQARAIISSENVQGETCTSEDDIKPGHSVVECTCCVCIYLVLGDTRPRCPGTRPKPRWYQHSVHALR